METDKVKLFSLALQTFFCAKHVFVGEEVYDILRPIENDGFVLIQIPKLKDKVIVITKDLPIGNYSITVDRMIEEYQRSHDFKSDFIIQGTNSKMMIIDLETCMPVAVVNLETNQIV